MLFRVVFLACSLTAAAAAHASWLMCNPERCISEDGPVSIELPIGKGEPSAAAIAGTRAALGETMAGKPVSNASTSPYGCTVKY